MSCHQDSAVHQGEANVMSTRPPTWLNGAGQQPSLFGPLRNVSAAVALCHVRLSSTHPSLYAIVDVELASPEVVECFQC